MADFLLCQCYYQALLTIQLRIILHPQYKYKITRYVRYFKSYGPEQSKVASPLTVLYTLCTTLRIGVNIKYYVTVYCKTLIKSADTNFELQVKMCVKRFILRLKMPRIQ